LEGHVVLSKGLVRRHEDEAFDDRRCHENIAPLRGLEVRLSVAEVYVKAFADRSELLSNPDSNKNRIAAVSSADGA
jgi:hypothetical protein